MTNKDLYDMGVKETRERFEKEGRSYFYRVDPNRKNMHDYAAHWQIGIGNEKEGLIDILVAKMWHEEDAVLLVEALNLHHNA